MPEITELLTPREGRDGPDLAAVFEHLYADLKRIASARVAALGPDQTLQATGLVHEAYLKLVGAHSLTLENRKHFFACAARAMRQILIDHARSRLADARRMQEVERELRDRPQEDAADLARMLELDSALDELEKINPRLAQVVLYRYFAGYTPTETAELLEVTERTVNRDWHKARAWLALAMTPADAGADDAGGA